MLLDDRRIVLTLEAICWCTAAMVFFQQTDFPRAMAPNHVPARPGARRRRGLSPAARGRQRSVDAAGPARSQADVRAICAAMPRTPIRALAQQVHAAAAAAAAHRRRARSRGKRPAPGRR